MGSVKKALTIIIHNFALNMDKNHKTLKMNCKLEFASYTKS